MKKILINTHPLGHNYGGIAQAYALQTALKSLGYSPESTASEGPFYVKYITHNKILRKLLGKKSLDAKFITSKYTLKFISKNITVVPFNSAKKKASQGVYDAYLAGSDQVWRSRYVHVPHYLFSFIKDESKTRISYAASFGRDDLEEYSPKLLKRTRKLAQKFDAISVREESGIALVREHWGAKAECHLDPTFLLEVDDYIQLIENPSSPLPESAMGGIFVYTLDRSPETEEILSKSEEILGMESRRLISGVRNNDMALPPIEQWFRGFRDADFVITDSFHGTVFSILFNKPFISVGNVDRGMARFTSLLRRLQLEDRLVTSPQEITHEKIARAVNWTEVNTIIAEERIKTKQFLQKHLGTN